MTILLTGAAGFIGSHLTDRLIADGHQVVGVDNFLTGSRENLAHLKTNPDFSLIEADAATSGWHDRLPSDHLDAILHLASPAGPHPTSPKSYHQLWQETYLVNTIGTHELLQLAAKHQAVFLFASTSEVYGDPEVHPQIESYVGHVNPVGPRAIYDESKRLGEAICAAWTRHRGEQTRIARIFNTFGPRMTPDDGRAIPLFISQALKNQPLTIHGDGTQTRSFCYTSDLVEGLIKLLESKLNAEPINLGNPEETTILDLAKKIITLTGSSSKLEFDQLPEDDPSRRRPDITKATHMLGWQPKVSLDEGLKKTISWFQKQE